MLTTDSDDQKQQQLSEAMKTDTTILGENFIKKHKTCKLHSTLKQVSWTSSIGCPNQCQ